MERKYLEFIIAAITFAVLIAQQVIKTRRARAEAKGVVGVWAGEVYKRIKESVSLNSSATLGDLEALAEQNSGDLITLLSHYVNWLDYQQADADSGELPTPEREKMEVLHRYFGALSAEQIARFALRPSLEAIRPTLETFAMVKRAQQASSEEQQAKAKGEERMAGMPSSVEPLSESISHAGYEAEGGLVSNLSEPLSAVPDGVESYVGYEAGAGLIHDYKAPLSAVPVREGGDSLATKVAEKAVRQRAAQQSQRAKHVAEITICGKTVDLRTAVMAAEVLKPYSPRRGFYRK